MARAVATIAGSVLLCSAAGPLSGGCASVGAAYHRPDVAAEERGVAELNDMLRDFKAAVRQPDLPRAEELLQSLEERAQQADPVTKSHPDFDDIARTIGLGRRALAVAKVKTSLEKSKQAIGEASRLLQSLAVGAPSAEKMQALEDALSRARAAREEIAGADVERQISGDLVERLGSSIAELETAQTQASWMYRTGSELVRVVDEALAAENQAAPPAPAAARLAGHQAAAAAFGACVQAAEQARSASGARADLQVQTGLGRMRIDELALTCNFRQISARRAYDKQRWSEEVTGIVRAIEDAGSRLRASSDPAAQQAAREAVTAAYGACHERLAHLRKDPGRDKRARFDTRLGLLTAERLRSACRREHAGMLEEKTGVRWHSAVGELRDRLKRAQQQMRRTARQRRPADRAGLLASALEGFEACIEGTSELARNLSNGARRLPGTRHKQATLRSLRRSCRKSYKNVKKRLRRLRRYADTSRPRTRGPAVLSWQHSAD